MRLARNLSSYLYPALTATMVWRLLPSKLDRILCSVEFKGATLLAVADSLLTASQAAMPSRYPLALPCKQIYDAAILERTLRPSRDCTVVWLAYTPVGAVGVFRPQFILGVSCKRGLSIKLALPNRLPKRTLVPGVRKQLRRQPTACVVQSVL